MINSVGVELLTVCGLGPSDDSVHLVRSVSSGNAVDAVAGDDNVVVAVVVTATLLVAAELDCWMDIGTH